MLRLSNEKGQTMGEYALIIGLVALVVIIGVTTLGTHLRDIWTVLAENIPGTIPG